MESSHVTLVTHVRLPRDGVMFAQLTDVWLQSEWNYQKLDPPLDTRRRLVRHERKYLNIRPTLEVQRGNLVGGISNRLYSVGEWDGSSGSHTISIVRNCLSRHWNRRYTEREHCQLFLLLLSMKSCKSIRNIVSSAASRSSQEMFIRSCGACETVAMLVWWIIHCVTQVIHDTAGDTPHIILYSQQKYTESCLLYRN